MIFDMRQQGRGTYMIARRLNGDGVPSPRNHQYRLGLVTHERYSEHIPWRNDMIWRLLSNEAYIGCLVQGKFRYMGKRQIKNPREEWIVHENAHPAIITPENFKAVQELMSEASGKYGQRKNSWDENIFVGKVFCTRCGKAAARESQYKNGKAYFSYHCRYCDDELKDAAHVTRHKLVSLNQLEAVVSGAIRGRMDACLELDGFLDKASTSEVIEQKCRNLKRERDKHRTEADKCGERLTAAYAHHLEGLLDKEEFELARAKFEQDKLAAAAALAQAEKGLSAYSLKEARENSALVNFLRFRGFEKLDRAVISALIGRVEITPMTNEINVRLNFKDDFEGLDKIIRESGVMVK